MFHRFLHKGDKPGKIRALVSLENFLAIDW